MYTEHYCHVDTAPTAVLNGFIMASEYQSLLGILYGEDKNWRYKIAMIRILVGFLFPQDKRFMVKHNLDIVA